jgi:SlyX protein
MDRDLENRLIELETRAAYQEDTILKLQALVEAHQKQLYHMETRMEFMRERLRESLTADTTDAIPNERPPHY